MKLGAQVILYPGRKRGEVAAEMSGEIAALWQLTDSKQKTRTSAEVRVSLVAGARNQRDHDKWQLAV